jgi:hypothetical protein
MLLFFSVVSLIGLLKVFKRRPGKAAGIDEDADSGTMALVSRMAFYLIVVEALYFHLGGSFFLPATWFYFGFAGLVTVTARNRFRAAAVLPPEDPRN